MSCLLCTRALPFCFFIKIYNLSKNDYVTILLLKFKERTLEITVLLLFLFHYSKIFSKNLLLMHGLLMVVEFIFYTTLCCYPFLLPV